MTLFASTPAAGQLQFTPFQNTRRLRRVLLVGSETLLEQGLSLLLSSRRDLEVMHGGADHIDALALSISQKQPDVVILCQPDQALLAGVNALMRSTKALSGIRMLVVNLQSNLIQVYQRKAWSIADHSTFIALVCQDR